MKKKVLVLGSSGMLGHQVVHYLSQFDEFSVISTIYRHNYLKNAIVLDVTQKNDLEKTIFQIKPDYIVNCTGVLIGGANDNTANAIYINAYLPHQIKDIANIINSKLIHVSTDCVFSGDRGQYTESDIKDGKDIYSKTKALGEIIDDKHITLRTSIIGPELKKEGEGLFHWFMGQTGEINGFTKAIWSGVTTIELAKAVKWSIESEVTGLYHITNGTTINKNDLLNLFKKHTKKDINIFPVDGKKVDKSFIDTRKEINYQIPDYDTMISDMILFMKNNQELYRQYFIG